MVDFPLQYGYCNDRGFLWIYIVAAVLLGEPIKKAMQRISYNRIIRKLEGRA